MEFAAIFLPPRKLDILHPLIYTLIIPLKLH